MGLVARLLGGEHRSSLANPDPWLHDALGGMPSAAGVSVTPEGALQQTAVYACVRVLAETVGSLPLLMYERIGEDGKRRAVGHPLYALLHDQPNPDMTAMEFREAMMGNLALRGNAYAQIMSDGSGRVTALWPLRSDRTRVLRAPNGDLVYGYLGGKGEGFLPADEVLHIRGLGGDGLVGWSPIRLAREAVGLALAEADYAGAFYGNGAAPGGVLEHPGKLSDAAYLNLKASWAERHQGARNANKPAILEEGMSWKSVAISQIDQQFLEQRKFSVAEIARIFGVPPHMIGDVERSTSWGTGIEQQSIGFVTYTLRPWLVRWEQACGVRLLTTTERRRYYVEHLVDGLLRGDTQQRYQAYAVGRQWGWLSANDIRRRESMDPVEGGDAYLVPLNMVPADEAGQAASAETSPAQRDESALTAEGRALPAGDREQRSTAARRRLATSYRRVFADTAKRIIRREEADVMREARRTFGTRGNQQFRAWLDDFYAAHRDWTAEQFGAALAAYADAVVPEALDEIGADPDDRPDMTRALADLAGAYAAEHVGISASVLGRAVDAAAEAGDDPVVALQETFDGWRDDRPGRIATLMAVAAGAAIAVHVWRRKGIRRLRWIAFGKSCAYCNGLSGRVVGIEETFLDAGADYAPEGAPSALRPRKPVRHAPAHNGCDCTVAPG